MDHDQVGLPGVGTFVAEMVPASFSDKGYTINPPYRRLSFYPSRLEDTLLIDFYAASNQLDLETARTYITQYLAELKSVLQERKSIILPGLGRLRATRENALFFVADEGLDIYPAGVGLRPVSLKSHVLEEEPVVIDVPPPVSGREVEPIPQPEIPEEEEECHPEPQLGAEGRGDRQGAEGREAVRVQAQRQPHRAPEEACRLHRPRGEQRTDRR